MKDKDKVIDSLTISLQEMQKDGKSTAGILKMTEQIRDLSNEKR